MKFLAPERFWTLLALLVLVGVYVFLQVRRKRYAVRFTNLSLLDQVAPKRPGWRRHVPAGCFILALFVMVTAWARPASPVQVPQDRATIIIAIDVSPSMKATDVPPNRLAAEQTAAKKFVDQIPERFNIGLVSFGGYAQSQQQPTYDHESVKRAVDGLQFVNSTAIGEAVFKSLDDIRNFDAQAKEKPPPSAIVLLSDGDNTVGRSISSAVDAATQAKVPVSTIAYGTDSGTIEQDGQQVPVTVNPEALRTLAEGTHGHAYRAESVQKLDAVYKDIGRSLGHRTEFKEIAAGFAGVGLLFALISAMFSLIWFQRLP
ncbi:MAG TPA: VWA domain-containing protein [Streptosporangiaceae bacterium]